MFVITFLLAFFVTLFVLRHIGGCAAFVAVVIFGFCVGLWCVKNGIAQ